MATYNGSTVYRPTWADPMDIQRWLERELFVGETLNFPCGSSTVGDVRADVDEDLGPDVVADLWEALEVFGEQSFDTVYCDPPYKFFGSYEGGYFPRDLWKIARKRLILQTPRCRVTLKQARKSWYVLEPKPGSPQTNVWLFQVFDRADESLEAFTLDAEGGR